MRRRGCPCSQNLWMWIEGAGRSGVQARDELGHRVAFLSVLEPARAGLREPGVRECRRAMSWATALPSSQFSSLLLREPGVREYRRAMSWATAMPSSQF